MILGRQSTIRIARHARARIETCHQISSLGPFSYTAADACSAAPVLYLLPLQNLAHQEQGSPVMNHSERAHVVSGGLCGLR